MTTWTPTTALGQIVFDAGFCYDPEQNIIYSRLDAPQRSGGYAYAYDASALAMLAYIDCEPIFFSYDGKQWMIELWKGQYGLETGCEIGVYNRPDSPPPYYLLLDKVIGVRPGDQAHSLFYQSADDEDMLNMQFVLKQDGNVLLHRDPMMHWWLTGFRWGNYTTPDHLVMEIQIQFPNTEMQTAFDDALQAMGYAVQVDGLTTSFQFDKPQTRQPWVDTTPAELQAVMASQQAIVALYNSMGFPTNDPNAVSDALAIKIGSWVAGKNLTFLAQVIAEGMCGGGSSSSDVAKMLGQSIGMSSSVIPEVIADVGYAISAWASWATSFLNAVGEFLDFACIVEIQNGEANDRAASDLVLVSDSDLKNSSFLQPPPSRIPVGTTARFYVQQSSKFHGTYAVVAYEYATGNTGSTLGTQSVRLTMSCPMGPYDNIATCSDSRFQLCATTGTNWGKPGQVPTSGHPLYVRYVWK